MICEIRFIVTIKEIPKTLSKEVEVTRRNGILFTFSFLFQCRAKRFFSSSSFFSLFDDHQHCVNFLMKHGTFIMYPAHTQMEPRKKQHTEYVTWCLNYKTNRQAENIWMREIKMEFLWVELVLEADRWNLWPSPCLASQEGGSSKSLHLFAFCCASS